jgi:hypothetical protein
MDMRWIWLPMLLTLAALISCGSGGSGGSGGGTATAEELPRVYHQAMADEDWSKVWNLFSAQAKELCTFNFFLQSRDWFKEQSGDSYDFWLGNYREFSEGDWEVQGSVDIAILRLSERDLSIDAVREDDGWHVAQSGEYQTCLPFRP